MHACAFFLGVLSWTEAAQALPVCQPYTVRATYISRWKPHNQAWQAEFTCENRVKAKLHAEDVDNPAQNYGTFFIVDMNDVLESQESFSDPCDAVAAYCSGKLEPLPDEIKAMMVESVQMLTQNDEIPETEESDADTNDTAASPESAEGDSFSVDEEKTP